MLINTIPCKVEFGKQTVLNFIKSIQEDHWRAIPYSHTSLQDIEKWNGISGDF